MCLSYIEHKEIHHTGIGWKAVHKNGDGGYSGVFYAQAFKPIGQRNYAVQNKVYPDYLRGSSQHTYTSGFHIFLNREDAVTYTNYLNGHLLEKNPPFVLAKVRYEKPLCCGRQKINQKDAECVVAEEMIILEEEVCA